MLSRFSSKGGFALVIALALLGFIMLLVLGLSSLLQVEAQSSSHQKEALLARANALLAVRIAMGELQKSTGADQVITARADLFVSDTQNREGIMHPYWLGAWQTAPVWDVAKPAYPNGGGDIYEQYYDRQAKWDQFDAETKRSFASRWLVSDSVLYDPTVPLDEERFARLANFSANQDLPAGAADAVYAPRVEIGESGNAFAWWVSDEAQKAKINISDPYYNGRDNTAQEVRSSLALRNAPEAVLNMNETLPSDWVRVPSVDSIYLFGDNIDANESLAFDFTVYGQGLLTSPTKGGLKKDLSLAFDLSEDDVFLSGHYTGRSDVFNFEALPDGLYSPLLSGNTKDRDENYLFVLKNVEYEDIIASGGTLRNFGKKDGRRVDSARWSLLAYHHNLYRFLDNPEKKVPSIDSQMIFQATKELRNIRRGEDSGVIGGMNFRTDSRYIRAPGKNPEEMNHWTRYKGQLFRETLNPNTKASFPDEEDFTTYPIVPVVTEVMLEVRVEYDPSGRVFFNYYPMVELTNPYDVKIKVVDDMKISLVGDHNVLDVKLHPTAKAEIAGVSENIWSERSMQLTSLDYSSLGLDPSNQVFSGGAIAVASDWNGNVGRRTKTDFLRYRTTNNLRFVDTNFAYNGYTFDQEVPWAGASEYAIFIDQSSVGVFLPGETKTFVNGSNSGVVSHNLVPGDEMNAFNYPLTKEIKDFEGLKNNNKINRIRFKSSWPSHPELYDRISVETAILPTWPGRGRKNRDLTVITYMGNDSDWISVDVARAPVGTEVNGNVVGLKPVYKNQNTDEKYLAINERPRNTESPIFTLHLQRRSLDQFEQYTSEEGLSGDHFLGRLNPRGLLSDHEHGISSALYPIPVRHGNANWQYVMNTDSSQINLVSMGSWGEYSSQSGNPVYFHVPRRPPLSLGEYRHANLGFFGHEPPYVIGSSLPPIAAHSGNFDLTRPYADWNNNWDYEIGSGTLRDPFLSFNTFREFNNTKVAARPAAATLLVDLPYLYNTSLWDDYFLSSLERNYKNTISSALSGEPLPNSRMRLRSTDERNEANIADYTRSAAELTVDGAFNVNSTSIKAWAALLSSMREVSPPQADGVYDNIFLRLPSMEEGSVWSGFSSLKDSDLFNALDTAYDDNPESLAAHIVQEVKARGPFLSLAHFINRQLVNDKRGEAGALQAAIVDSDINGSNHPYALGSLTQPDLVSALGPVLTARGDTFTIRTKGERLNPTTGTTEAEAWCEAVVQRMPEYVDSSADQIYTAPDLLTSPINQQFGRRYKLLGIRWLSSDEI